MNYAPVAGIEFKPRLLWV